MVLDGIDVFVAVVQAGSFGGAARRLGMPPATVSAKLARLEERLGVPLIQRTTRTMHVTDAGLAFHAHCAAALSGLALGEEQLAGAAGTPSGVLRLTASSDGAQLVLPAIIGRFIAAYPKVSVELTVTNRQVDLLAEGIDLALRAGPMKSSSLQSRKFAPTCLGLFGARHYLAARSTPRTPDDLAAHDVMVHSRLPRPLILTSPTGHLELTGWGRVRADDMQAIRALAVQGTALALLPDLPAAVQVAGLVRVLPDYEMQPGNLYLVYPAGKFTPANVRAFVAMATGRARVKAAPSDVASAGRR